MTTLLTVRAVHKRFSGVVALDGVDLDVEEGSITGLIGPNGSGKTTMMNVLTGLYIAERGAVRLADADLTGHPPHRIAAAGVARSFQNIRLFPALSTRENVLLGTHLARRANLLDVVLRLPRPRREERDARQKVDALLESLGLAHLADVVAAHLSYGDRRRVEIARALALEPRLLLLDEPAAGMNHTEKDHLAKLIQHIRQQGVTVLLIEHDIDMLTSICDALTVLNFGRRIAFGTPSQVIADPAVIDAYLGSNVKSDAHA